MCLCERLALLEHHERRQVVLTRGHQRREARQDPGSLLCGLRLPGGERAFCRLDRAPRLGRAEARHLGDCLARRRVHDGERLAAVGVDPAAVDIGVRTDQVGSHGRHARDDTRAVSTACDRVRRVVGASTARSRVHGVEPHPLHVAETPTVARRP